MHMADALLSPAVGGTMWVAAAGAVTYCSSRVRREHDDRKTALMGVLGAFIFAAQMINFTIPGTGSSGHLGGGMILAILLGPHAAFLVMASVLTVQSLFFADGGLLALGCNIINLAFFPCFVAYPFIFKTIAGSEPTEKRIIAGAILSAVAGLQLGALAVVMQTVFSGISELPFRSFVLLMQPIHLVIGIIEGLATAAVVVFVRRSRPEILHMAYHAQPFGSIPIKKMALGLLTAAFLLGGSISWFASAHPDGLEWAILKVTGSNEVTGREHELHSSLAEIQQRFSFLPDYGFRGMEDRDFQGQEQSAERWPAVDSGTSLAGLLGGAITLFITAAFGLLLSRRKSTL